MSVVRKNLRAVYYDFPLERFLSVLSTMGLLVQDESVLSGSNFCLSVYCRKFVKTTEIAWKSTQLGIPLMIHAVKQKTYRSVDKATVSQWIAGVTCNLGNWTRWLGRGEVALWIHRLFHHALIVCHFSRLQFSHKFTYWNHTWNTPYEMALGEDLVNWLMSCYQATLNTVFISPN